MSKVQQTLAQKLIDPANKVIQVNQTEKTASLSPGALKMKQYNNQVIKFHPKDIKIINKDVFHQNMDANQIHQQSSKKTIEINQDTIDEVNQSIINEINDKENPMILSQSRMKEEIDLSNPNIIIIKTNNPLKKSINNSRITIGRDATPNHQLLQPQSQQQQRNISSMSGDDINLRSVTPNNNGEVSRQSRMSSQAQKHNEEFYQMRLNQLKNQNKPVVITDHLIEKEQTPIDTIKIIDRQTLIREHHNKKAINQQQTPQHMQVQKRQINADSAPLKEVDQIYFNEMANDIQTQGDRAAKFKKSQIFDKRKKQFKGNNTQISYQTSSNFMEKYYKVQQRQFTPLKTFYNHENHQAIEADKNSQQKRPDTKIKNYDNRQKSQNSPRLNFLQNQTANIYQKSQDSQNSSLVLIQNNQNQISQQQKQQLISKQMKVIQDQNKVLSDYNGTKNIYKSKTNVKRQHTSVIYKEQQALLAMNLNQTSRNLLDQNDQKIQHLIRQYNKNSSFKNRNITKLSFQPYSANRTTNYRENHHQNTIQANQSGQVLYQLAQSNLPSHEIEIIQNEPSQNTKETDQYLKSELYEINQRSQTPINDKDIDMPVIGTNGEQTTFDKVALDDKIMDREDCLSLPKLSNLNKESLIKSNADVMKSPSSIDQSQSIEFKAEIIKINRIQIGSTSETQSPLQLQHVKNKISSKQSIKQSQTNSLDEQYSNRHSKIRKNTKKKIIKDEIKPQIVNSQTSRYQHKEMKSFIATNTSLDCLKNNKYFNNGYLVSNNVFGISSENNTRKIANLQKRSNQKSMTEKTEIYLNNIQKISENLNMFEQQSFGNISKMKKINKGRMFQNKVNSIHVGKTSKLADQINIDEGSDQNIESVDRKVSFEISQKDINMQIMITDNQLEKIQETFDNSNNQDTMKTGKTVETYAGDTPLNLIQINQDSLDYDPQKTNNQLLAIDQRNQSNLEFDVRNPIAAESKVSLDIIPQVNQIISNQEAVSRNKQDLRKHRQTISTHNYQQLQFTQPSKASNQIKLEPMQIQGDINKKNLYNQYFAKKRSVQPIIQNEKLFKQNINLQDQDYNTNQSKNERGTDQIVKLNDYYQTQGAKYSSLQEKQDNMGMQKSFRVQTNDVRVTNPRRDALYKTQTNFNKQINQIYANEKQQHHTSTDLAKGTRSSGVNNKQTRNRPITKIENNKFINTSGHQNSNILVGEQKQNKSNQKQDYFKGKRLTIDNQEILNQDLFGSQKSGISPFNQDTLNEANDDYKFTDHDSIYKDNFHNQISSSTFKKGKQSVGDDDRIKLMKQKKQYINSKIMNTEYSDTKDGKFLKTQKGQKFKNNIRGKDQEFISEIINGTKTYQQQLGKIMDFLPSYNKMENSRDISSSRLSRQKNKPSNPSRQNSKFPRPSSSLSRNSKRSSRPASQTKANNGNSSKTLQKAIVVTENKSLTKPKSKLNLMQKIEEQSEQYKKQKNFQIEDFEEIQVLGQGSFGIVRLVKHLRTNKYYALKCLKKNQIRNKKHIQHITNERNILQRFTPDHFCCNIFETMQDSQNLYMILEYLSGGELIKQIRQTVYLSEEISRFYLAEIVLAVESLHSHGIIYRDLKPQNILIDNDGHIKLIDFGFAKMMKDIKNDKTYTNCGTPGYCAPEVMLANVGHTYKADMWSIGILMCQLIGGFIPFQNEHEQKNPKQIMDKCRGGKLNLPKNLTLTARELVISLLNEDPMQRLEIEEIKKHPFFRKINWNKILQREIQPPYIPDMDQIIQQAEMMYEQKTQNEKTIFDNLQLATQSSASPLKEYELSEKKTYEKSAKVPLEKSGEKTQNQILEKQETKELEQIPEYPVNEFTFTQFSKITIQEKNDDEQKKGSSVPRQIRLNNIDSTMQLNNTIDSFSRKSIDPSYHSSKKYSATGGTGGPSAWLNLRNKSSSKVLGDYHMVMVNKAFIDF